MPGMVDSHVHVTFSASAVPFEDIQNDGDLTVGLRGAINARDALLAGVTVLRDLGGRQRTTLELRNAIAAGAIPGPRLLVCGRPVTIPNGHCHFLGGVAQGVPAVTKLTAELVEEGVDAIKVMATGGNMTVTSDPLKAQFTREEITAIVGVADRPAAVTAHARGVDGIRVAAEANAHGIEHCQHGGEWATGSSTTSCPASSPTRASSPRPRWPPAIAPSSARPRAARSASARERFLSSPARRTRRCSARRACGWWWAPMRAPRCAARRGRAR